MTPNDLVFLVSGAGIGILVTLVALNCEDNDKESGESWQAYVARSNLEDRTRNAGLTPARSHTTLENPQHRHDDAA